MNIWRMQLKPQPKKGISFKDILHFCKNNQLIGMGWCGKRLPEDTPTTYWERNYPQDKSAKNNMKSIGQIEKGDLIWTRVGGEANEYYLCQVGDKVWKDCFPTEEMRKYDIGNFVSATWVKIGSIDYVPGRVINSFCAPKVLQPVKEVETISKYIWNQNCPDENAHYPLAQLTVNDFWNSINSEELECLVLLFLQQKGYYIYSTTLKISTARYETVMIYKDGSHKALPQVKRNKTLDVKNYISDANQQNKVYLFTTSENYGTATHPQVYCIQKAELFKFIQTQTVLLPHNIKYWMNMLGTQTTSKK